MASKNGTWLVFEGDWGGQMYLTVPVALVRNVDAKKFHALLKTLDAAAWSCNDGMGRSYYPYTPAEVGSDVSDGVPGGMGGGKLLDGLWLHPELESMRTLVCDLLGIKNDRSSEVT